MATFQDLLDSVARVVGGTVSPNDPRFFSGALAGDGTGVATLNGCYSVAPLSLSVATPVAIVTPESFTANGPAGVWVQGQEDVVDDIRVLVLIGGQDAESSQALLNVFRDTVPAAFRAHFQLYASPNVDEAGIVGGRAGVHEWGDASYLGWDLVLRVRRTLPVTYTP